jgi:hypothetical protein
MPQWLLWIALEFLYSVILIWFSIHWAWKHPQAGKAVAAVVAEVKEKT